MKLDHICIATRSIEAAAKKLCDSFGYRIKTKKVTNTRQQVNVQFLEKDDSIDIKIIEPSNKDSPLVDFVRKGGGLHHICFLSDNVSQQCKELSEKGIKIITPPQPGEAFDDELIAFCYAGFGLNIELIDTEKRRDLIEKNQID